MLIEREHQGGGCQEVVYRRMIPNVDVHVSVNSSFHQIDGIQLICQIKSEQKIQLNVNSYWFYSFKAESSSLANTATV